MSFLYFGLLLSARGALFSTNDIFMSCCINYHRFTMLSQKPHYTFHYQNWLKHHHGKRILIMFQLVDQKNVCKCFLMSPEGGSVF